MYKTQIGGKILTFLYCSIVNGDNARWAHKRTQRRRVEGETENKCDNSDFVKAFTCDLFNI